MIFQASLFQKQSGVGMFLSERANFKPKLKEMKKDPTY
jgi:hypothetical protein